MARFLAIGLVATFLWAAVAAPARAEEADDGMAIKVKWGEGLKIESKNKEFKFQVGGRIQSDWWNFIGPKDADLNPLTYRSGHVFRRARLFVAGTMYKHISWKAEYDFAGASTSFTDVYVAAKGLDECWGCLFPDIQIGHFKEPFSLEELTSSRFITFIERSLPVSAFSPARNTGLKLSRALYGDRINIAAGVFGTNTPSSGNFSWDEGYDLSGRVTWAAWAPCDCPCRVLHLGASAIYTDYSRTFRPTFSTRPETGIGDSIATTGVLATADSAFRYGAELAFVYDKFSVQGEYIGCEVDTTTGNDPSFNGFYVMGSWMITGPCRNYKLDGAAFDRVKPCNNFGCNGWGGWELAARYSSLDLTDAGVNGGEVWDVTVALNWYLNPNTRLMLNFVHSDLQNRGGVVDGTVDAVGVRVQVDF